MGLAEHSICDVNEDSFLFATCRYKRVECGAHVDDWAGHANKPFDQMLEIGTGALESVAMELKIANFQSEPRRTYRTYADGGDL